MIIPFGSRYKNIILLLFFTSTFLQGTSQPMKRIDSLVHELNSTRLNSSKKINQLNQLSLYYHEAENYSEALKYKVRALELLKEGGHDSLAARAKEKIGVMFYRTGSYDMSASYFLDALEYFEEREYSILVAQTMGNLANVYTRIDNHTRAIDYLEQSKELYKKEDARPITLAGLYINLGLAYTGNKEYENAMHYYEQAYDFIKDKGNDLYTASVLNNMGEVHFSLKQFQEANTKYNKALDLFKNIDNKNGIGSALSNLAKVAIEKKEYQKAVELAKEALNYFRDIDAKFFIADVQKQMVEAYKRMGDYRLSMVHMEKYNRQQEAIKGAEITDRIAAIEMEYKLRKEEQKIQLLKKQSELKAKESKLNTIKLWTIIAGILVLLVVTVLIIFNQRGRLQRNALKQQILQREQDQLHNELAFKKREIENFAIHINEKNQLLENLNSEIRKVVQNSAADYSDLKEIKNLVNQSLFIDKNRKELELKINQAQRAFLHRLKSKFDRLTKTDLRLCSFILLDFSTKEIATFMNIEPSSVKMSRNRLRKKLNLPQNSDIKSFLDEI